MYETVPPFRIHLLCRHANQNEPALGLPKLNIEVVVETTADGVIERIDLAARRAGVVLERIEDE
jgi:hypothetical protein